MNITFVTAYFDLAKIENNEFRRKADHYLEYGKKLLERDINLIIYIEEENVEYISTLRESFKNNTTSA